MSQIRNLKSFVLLLYKWKVMEIPTMTIVIRAAFLENNKNYPQFFLD